MGRRHREVHDKIASACIVLALFVNFALANSCLTGFTYDSEHDLCTHTILGDPASPTDYCIALSAASKFQIIDGVEMCTMLPVTSDSGGNGGGIGGGLPSGRR